LVEALGHVRPGGLVADGDEPYGVLVERRQQRVDLGRRETEDEAHALVREAAGQQPSTVQLGHRTPPRETDPGGHRRLSARSLVAASPPGSSHYRSERPADPERPRPRVP